MCLALIFVVGVFGGILRPPIAEASSNEIALSRDSAL